MFRAEVALAVESALESTVKSTVYFDWAEVHLFICVSSMSANFLRCQLGKEGVWACGSDEA